MASSDPNGFTGGRVGEPGPLPHVRIQPASGWRALNLRQLWDARELVGFLTWRDISVRYKQTALGASWAVIQPFLMMVVFSVFFGRLAGIPSDGVPYPIFAFCALLPWQFFAYSLNQGGTSLVKNQALVTKAYFPRLAIPVSAVLGGFVDFLVASVVLGGMMIFYGVGPDLNVLVLPLFVLLVIVTALGTSLVLSALAVEFRDVQYTVPFLVQFGLFVTPIAFPLSIVPDSWAWLLGLNPMAGVVEGFRWSLLGTEAPPLALMALSFGVAAIVLLAGLLYFRRVEDSFADRI